MGHELLSIITAKGKSTGLPNKNLRLLCGKPLVQWTIEASLQSHFITRTIVSSDKKEILALSKQLGADPIERPPKLATDTTDSESVLVHVIDYLKKSEGYIPDVLILLQPTSPLRTYKDIDEAMNLYFDSACSAVISGFKLENNSLKDFIIDGEDRLKAITNDKFPFTPRQQLPQTFRSNGAIYIIKADLFMQKHTLLTNNTRPFIMDKHRSIDINNMEDFIAAEDYLNKENCEVSIKKLSINVKLAHKYTESTLR
ncbi:MAG: acylneuraminate cytidylyltransferase family protein [Sedimentisphaerales bacterium]|nr:acylneuraminate cytidylyltransferase family protein [Sedimentisphaerales bacterium]